MAFVIADRVKETTTSTGTTAITLAGAVTGYQTFSASIGNANTTYYTIVDQSGANWEVGVGTYTSSGNTLSRDTVLASSNSGSLVTFTSGTKDVFVSAPAERFGPNWQTVQTGNFTTSSNCAYPVDTTSAAITATLPASPKVNDIISFVDYAGTFATNNLTINPNGNKLDGVTPNQLVATNRAYLNLLYVNSTQGWITISNVTPNAQRTINYLIVAGGAGGGGGHGGGGGAGGYITNNGGTALNVNVGTSYSVVIGAAGAGGVYNSTVATNGSDSTAFSLTAIGGGRGGCQNATGGPYPNGVAGGSGGGGANTTSGSGTGGSGTSGQGYAGGTAAYNGSNWGSAGGGGAGSVGQDTTSASTGGNGGTGKNTESTWATATTTGVNGYYASGGAGNKGTATNGGGNGAPSDSGGDVAGAGTINTGSGGGGGRAVTGGNGGSGIVIIRYAGSQVGTGGTVVTTGGYTYHTFTSSGTYIA